MATDTWIQHEADADNAGYKDGSSDQYQAALTSHSIMDMYYEGRGMLLGLYRMWQTSGYFEYLDRAFDMVEGDIDAAVNLQSYYNSIIPSLTPDFGGYRMPKWDALGNVLLPNRWTESPYNYTYNPDTSPGSFNWFNPPLNQFIGTTGYSYNYVEARDSNAYVHEPLGENIYYRYAADMLRIIYNNDDNGSILNLTSGNGQTYQQRFDKVKTHLEGLYTKWVEETNANEIGWFVYRQNTHMGNHLPSTALCLWKITGNQKYLDFVNTYLYTWGDQPNSNDVPAGSAFMKQMGVDGGDALVWSSSWGSSAANGGTGQDINHAAEEIIFLVQCYQEGIGTSPPSGVMAIDATLISRLVNMALNNSIVSPTGISYRITNGDGAFLLKNISTGVCYLAEFDEGILDWVENNFSGNEYSMQWYGNRAYAASVHEVGGESTPVYPSDGVGGITPPPINNTPTVTRIGDFRIDINVGDTYVEQGASWADVEDGTGTLTVATTGTVDVNTVGVYVLTYQYTDSGGKASNIEYRNVYVNQSGNQAPVVSLVGNPGITLSLGDPYIEQGATWTDAEDGSGSIVSPSSGSVPVDGSNNTTTVGSYQLIYNYTDSQGSISDDVIRTVDVVDTSGDIQITSFSWDVDVYEMSVGQSSLPESTILPSNATLQFLFTQSSNPDIADINENGFLRAIRPGVITLTGTTLDGSNISDTVTVVIKSTSPQIKSKNILPLLIN